MTLEEPDPQPPVNTVNPVTEVNPVPDPHCHQLGIDFAQLPHAI